MTTTETDPARPPATGQPAINKSLSSKKSGLSRAARVTTLWELPRTLSLRPAICKPSDVTILFNSTNHRNY